VKEKNVWRVNGPTDFDNIYQVVSQLDEEFKKKYPYFRLAYLTLSSAITQADERDAMNFFQRLVNRLRQTKVVSVVALERGMHNDQTLEALEHMVDGAIHFKSDKQKTQLQVVGLGEVQTHDWVPYKFTNKAIMIGSFQLERIR
jgi:KaiC/GvpD/RAD55 family RecA-like ATPase